MTLADKENLNSPETVSNALKLLFSIAQLLNKLMVFYNIEGSPNEGFFNSANEKMSRPVDTEMWEHLTHIFGILATHIIERGNHYQ